MLVMNVGVTALLVIAAWIVLSITVTLAALIHEPRRRARGKHR